MTRRTRHYDPIKCSNTVKEVIKAKNVIITLCGHHAHEWSIMKTSNGTTTVTNYPNRIIARKNWKELSKLYR